MGTSNAYRQCIATIATVDDVSELLSYEQQHVCNPVLVERFSNIRPPSSEPVDDSQNAASCANC
jgi:hypothetical protein